MLLNGKLCMAFYTIVAMKLIKWLIVKLGTTGIYEHKLTEFWLKLGA